MVIARKIVSVVLVAGLLDFQGLLPQISLLSQRASSAPTTSLEPAQILEELVAPKLSAYGRIGEKFLPSGNEKPFILHIRDLHCNEEAQMNIAKILKTVTGLQSPVSSYKENINDRGPGTGDWRLLVLTEGAEGEVDTSLFASFPDAEIRRTASKEFMKEGKMTGPEFLSISEPEIPIKIMGVEDGDLYVQNFKAFRDVIGERQVTGEFLKEVGERLDGLRGKVYSKELLELDDKARGYKAGTVALDEWVKYLAEKYQISSIKNQDDESKFKDSKFTTHDSRLTTNLLLPSNYPNFGLIIQVLEAQKGIDLDQVEKERNELMEELSQKLPKEELGRIIKKSLEFRLGRVTAVEYFGELEKFMSGERNLESFKQDSSGDSVPNNRDGHSVRNDSRYPSLSSYIALVKEQARIDQKRLHDELEAITQELTGKLTRTEDEKEILEFGKQFELIKKMFSLELTREELTTLSTQSSVLSTFIEDLGRLALKHAIELPVNTSSETYIRNIARVFEDGEHFYELALKRDEMMVSKALETISLGSRVTSHESKGKINPVGPETGDWRPVTVLITGGFHSEGVTELLKNQNVAYAVVTPKVSKEPNMSTYYNLMLDEKVSFQTLAFISLFNTLAEAAGIEGESVLLDLFLSQFSKKFKGIDRELLTKWVDGWAAGKKKEGKPLSEAQQEMVEGLKNKIGMPEGRAEEVERLTNKQLETLILDVKNDLTAELAVKVVEELGDPNLLAQARTMLTQRQERALLEFLKLPFNKEKGEKTPIQGKRKDTQLLKGETLTEKVAFVREELKRKLEGQGVNLEVVDKAVGRLEEIAQLAQKAIAEGKLSKSEEGRYHELLHSLEVTLRAVSNAVDAGITGEMLENVTIAAIFHDVAVIEQGSAVYKIHEELSAFRAREEALRFGISDEARLTHIAKLVLMTQFGELFFFPKTLYSLLGQDLEVVTPEQYKSEYRDRYRENYGFGLRFKKPAGWQMPAEDPRLSEDPATRLLQQAGAAIGIADLESAIASDRYLAMVDGLHDEYAISDDHLSFDDPFLARLGWLSAYDAFEGTHGFISFAYGARLAVFNKMLGKDVLTDDRLQDLRVNDAIFTHVQKLTATVRVRALTGDEKANLEKLRKLVLDNKELLAPESREVLVNVLLLIEVDDALKNNLPLTSTQIGRLRAIRDRPFYAYEAHRILSRAGTPSDRVSAHWYYFSHYAKNAGEYRKRLAKIKEQLKDQALSPPMKNKLSNQEKFYEGRLKVIDEAMPEFAGLLGNLLGSRDVTTSAELEMYMKSARKLLQLRVLPKEVSDRLLGDLMVAEVRIDNLRRVEQSKRLLEESIAELKLNLAGAPAYFEGMELKNADRQSIWRGRILVKEGPDGTRRVDEHNVSEAIQVLSRESQPVQVKVNGKTILTIRMDNRFFGRGAIANLKDQDGENMTAYEALGFKDSKAFETWLEGFFASVVRERPDLKKKGFPIALGLLREARLPAEDHLGNGFMAITERIFTHPGLDAGMRKFLFELFIRHELFHESGIGNSQEDERKLLESDAEYARQNGYTARDLIATDLFEQNSPLILRLLAAELGQDLANKGVRVTAKDVKDHVKYLEEVQKFRTMGVVERLARLVMRTYQPPALPDQLMGIDAAVEEMTENFELTVESRDQVIQYLLDALNGKFRALVGGGEKQVEKGRDRETTTKAEPQERSTVYEPTEWSTIGDVVNGIHRYLAPLMDDVITRRMNSAQLKIQFDEEILFYAARRLREIDPRRTDAVMREFAQKVRDNYIASRWREARAVGTAAYFGEVGQDETTPVLQAIMTNHGRFRFAVVGTREADKDRSESGETADESLGTLSVSDRQNTLARDAFEKLLRDNKDKPEYSALGNFSVVVVDGADFSGHYGRTRQRVYLPIEILEIAAAVPSLGQALIEDFIEHEYLESLLDKNKQPKYSHDDVVDRLEEKRPKLHEKAQALFTIYQRIKNMSVEELEEEAKGKGGSELLLIRRRQNEVRGMSRQVLKMFDEWAASNVTSKEAAQNFFVGEIMPLLDEPVTQDALDTLGLEVEDPNDINRRELKSVLEKALIKQNVLSLKAMLQRIDVTREGTPRAVMRMPTQAVVPVAKRATQPKAASPAAAVARRSLDVTGEKAQWWMGFDQYKRLREAERKLIDKQIETLRTKLETARKLGGGLSPEQAKQVVGKLENQIRQLEEERGFDSVEREYLTLISQTVHGVVERNELRARVNQTLTENDLGLLFGILKDVGYVELKGDGKYYVTQAFEGMIAIQGEEVILLELRERISSNEALNGREKDIFRFLQEASERWQAIAGFMKKKYVDERSENNPTHGHDWQKLSILLGARAKRKTDIEERQERLKQIEKARAALAVREAARGQAPTGTVIDEAKLKTLETLRGQLDEREVAALRAVKAKPSEPKKSLEAMRGELTKRQEREEAQRGSLQPKQQAARRRAVGRPSAVAPKVVEDAKRILEALGFFDNKTERLTGELAQLGLTPEQIGFEQLKEIFKALSQDKPSVEVVFQGVKYSIQIELVPSMPLNSKGYKTEIKTGERVIHVTAVRNQLNAHAFIEAFLRAQLAGKNLSPEDQQLWEEAIDLQVDHLRRLFNPVVVGQQRTIPDNKVALSVARRTMADDVKDGNIDGLLERVREAERKLQRIAEMQRRGALDPAFAQFAREVPTYVREAARQGIIRWIVSSRNRISARLVAELKLGRLTSTSAFRKAIEVMNTTQLQQLIGSIKAWQPSWSEKLASALGLKGFWENLWAAFGHPGGATQKSIGAMGIDFANVVNKMRTVGIEFEEVTDITQFVNGLATGGQASTPSFKAAFPEFEEYVGAVVRLLENPGAVAQANRTKNKVTAIKIYNIPNWSPVLDDSGLPIGGSVLKADGTLEIYLPAGSSVKAAARTIFHEIDEMVFGKSHREAALKETGFETNMVTERFQRQLAWMTDEQLRAFVDRYETVQDEIRREFQNDPAKMAYNLEHAEIHNKLAREELARRLGESLKRDYALMKHVVDALGWRRNEPLEDEIDGARKEFRAAYRALSGKGLTDDEIKEVMAAYLKGFKDPMERGGLTPSQALEAGATKGSDLMDFAIKGVETIRARAVGDEGGVEMRRGQGHRSDQEANEEIRPALEANKFASVTVAGEKEVTVTQTDFKFNDGVSEREVAKGQQGIQLGKRDEDRRLGRLKHVVEELNKNERFKGALDGVQIIFIRGLKEAHFSVTRNQIFLPLELLGDGKANELAKALYHETVERRDFKDSLQRAGLLEQYQPGTQDPNIKAIADAAHNRVQIEESAIAVRDYSPIDEMASKPERMSIDRDLAKIYELPLKEIKNLRKEASVAILTYSSEEYKKAMIKLIQAYQIKILDLVKIGLKDWIAKRSGMGKVRLVIAVSRKISSLDLSRTQKAELLVWAAGEIVRNGFARKVIGVIAQIWPSFEVKRAGEAYADIEGARSGKLWRGISNRVSDALSGNFVIDEKGNVQNRAFQKYVELAERKVVEKDGRKSGETAEAFAKRIRETASEAAQARLRQAAFLDYIERLIDMRITDELAREVMQSMGWENVSPGELRRLLLDYLRIRYEWGSKWGEFVGEEGEKARERKLKELLDLEEGLTREQIERLARNNLDLEMFIGDKLGDDVLSESTRAEDQKELLIRLRNEVVKTKEGKRIEEERLGRVNRENQAIRALAAIKASRGVAAVNRNMKTDRSRHQMYVAPFQVFAKILEQDARGMKVENRGAGAASMMEKILKEVQKGAEYVVTTGPLTKAEMIEFLGIPLELIGEGSGKVNIVEGDWVGEEKSLAGIVERAKGLREKRGEPFTDETIQADLVVLLDEETKSALSDFDRVAAEKKYKLAVGKIGATRDGSLVPDLFAMGARLGAKNGPAYINGELDPELAEWMKGFIEGMLRDVWKDEGKTDAEIEREVAGMVAEVAQKGYFKVPPITQDLNQDIRELAIEETYIAVAA